MNHIDAGHTMFQVNVPVTHKQLGNFSQFDFDLGRVKRQRSLFSSSWKGNYFVLIYVSRATSWTRRSFDAYEVKIELYLVPCIHSKFIITTP